MPKCSRRSIIAIASRASSSGNVWWTSGVICPRARELEAPLDLVAGVDERADDLLLARKNGMMSNGTTSPEWPPQITSRPSFASESSPFWKSSPPTCSKTRSTPRPSVSRITSLDDVLRRVVDAVRPCRARLARASFSSELALPITNAPASCASWTAAEPMPLPTELISTVSPGCSRPRVNSMCHAVPKAIWSAAAASSAELVRARGSGGRAEQASCSA